MATGGNLHEVYFFISLFMGDPFSSQSDLKNTVPPLHLIVAQSGNKLLKGSTGRGAINDVIRKWRVNGYGYIFIPYACLGVIVHWIVRCLSYDSPRNSTDATE